MNKKLLVTKHNCLIEASYRLSTEEQRLILSCVAKVNPKSKAGVPDEITISAKEYSENFGIQLKHAYEQLKEATDNLYNRSIRLKGEGNDGEEGKGQMRWVYHAKYYPGACCVKLKFSPDIKPYLCQMNGLFTSYELIHVSGLKSSYSIRLYELLKQWSKTGKRFIRVEDFRRILMLENKYQKFSDLRKWVIQPAVNELTDKTDVSVDFHSHREGRRIAKLEFIFGKK